jgi:hypothetical protein
MMGTDIEAAAVAAPSTPNLLDNPPIPVQAKLAAAWTSVMFLYAYVDILAFFKPGVIDDILAGKVWEFDVSQTLLTTFLALMAIPIFMVVLSMTLPARANRITNLIVASVQVPYAAFNVVGESWTYFYGLGVALEVILLALILRYAWKWPRTPAVPAGPAKTDHHAIRPGPQEPRPAPQLHPRRVHGIRNLTASEGGKDQLTDRADERASARITLWRRSSFRVRWPR